MGKGERLPIIIPRLEDPASASADERDEHLMLLESARHALDVEWTETLAVADAEKDHDLFGYPSTVAYRKHRLRVAGSRPPLHEEGAGSDDLQVDVRGVETSSDLFGRGDSAVSGRRTKPDRYLKAEDGLLELVGDGYDETRWILDYWSNRVDPEGVVIDLEAQLARRRFDVTRRGNGMVAGEFELPRAAGGHSSPLSMR